VCVCVCVCVQQDGAAAVCPHAPVWLQGAAEAAEAGAEGAREELVALRVADTWDVRAMQKVEAAHAAALATLADGAMCGGEAAVLAVLEPFLKAATKKHAPKGCKPLPLPPTLLSAVLRRCAAEGLWEVAGVLIKGGHVSTLAPCPSLLESLLAARRLDLAEKLLRQLRDVPGSALEVREFAV
jgi:hypothetical protein